MRTTAAMLTLFVAGPLLADDAEAVAKQRTAIEDAWKTLQLPAATPVESANLLVVGTLPEAKLKAAAATLEKQYDTAMKALKFEGSDRPVTGKVAVYLFDDRSKYRSFVRSVVKSNPENEEQSRQSLRGDTPFVAAGPGGAKDAPPPETRAGTEIAIGLLAARSRNTPVPEWASLGFARATAYQAAGAGAATRKRAARDLIRRSKLRDLWGNTLNAEQKLTLGTSLMDFLFYGKGVTKPIDVVTAMRPEDDKPVKTADDIFAATQMKPELFEAAFVKWLRAN